jgi:hypothetical protein
VSGSLQPNLPSHPWLRGRRLVHRLLLLPLDGPVALPGRECGANPGAVTLGVSGSVHLLVG